MANQIVQKTAKEIEMNNFYMDLIRLNGIVPETLIEKFKRDRETIRLENPLYNSQIN